MRKRRFGALLLALGALLGASPARAEQPPPVVAFLNFSNGTEAISAGDGDDATHNVSSLCATERVGAYWGSSDCGDRVTCAAAILDLVEGHFRDFNIVFTLDRPKSGPYTMAMIGPPSGSCGFGVEGAAPLDCNDENPENVVFAFDCAASAAACSVTISQELAHSFGLAHTVQTCDIMTPGSANCSDPHFSDTDALADDTRCGIVQNNHQRLLEVLGPWTGGESHRLSSENGDENAGASGCSVGPAPSRGMTPLVAILIISLAGSIRSRCAANPRRMRASMVKRSKRKVSWVSSELDTEAARQDARDRALSELGSGVKIFERDVRHWLEKLGAAGRRGVP